MHDEHPVQQPADPAAVGDEMTRMKQAADAAIARAATALSHGQDAMELLRETTRAILEAMPPTFGPANAWLYNERDAKLGELCRQLGLEPANCEPVIAAEQAKLP